MADNLEVEETIESLRRLQEFDPTGLVREVDLGRALALNEVVEPARRVLDLFKLISLSHISLFPAFQQGVIKQQADAFYNLISELLAFDVNVASPTPAEAKAALILRVEQQFQPIFDVLYPLISFASVRSLDFAELERGARAAAQAATDQAKAISTLLEERKKTSDSIINEMQLQAAEQGVSKQAIHFKTEADNHAGYATTWLKRSVWTAIGLGCFAVFSLFIHKIQTIEPKNAYETTQLAISKVLMFGVISYMLLLCARNFMSHKHNEIINRHRQNALATFTALAEATSDAGSSDVVLSHAAACIFSPQETGYAKQATGHADVGPALQLLPRIQQAVGSGG